MNLHKAHQAIIALAISGVSLCACGGDDNASIFDGGPSAEITDAAAAGDGAVVQCQADHQESLEARNDRIVNDANQVEPTGLVMSTQSGFSICGQVDPRQEFGVFADVDVYEFSVSSDQDIRLSLTLDTQPSDGDVDLILFRADGPSTVVEAKLVGDIALTHRVAPAGTYWIAVLAKTPSTGSTLPYRIEVSPNPVDCEPATAGDGDYSEELDGSDNRGNDTLRVDYDDGSMFSETPSSTDAPEPTKISLFAGERTSIFGVAADVPPLDDYRDRDAFVIHTGPETIELAVRLVWIHSVGVDLDLHLFEAGAPEHDLSSAGAATVGTGQDEVTTMAVLPDHDYWLWVGAYANAQSQLPQDYAVTLCGKSL
ncbi:MAG: hypothetical protein GY811_04145 [Myxococcales bacterium]|nr:hypothetical protein [Myxococcales bacterium]